MRLNNKVAIITGGSGGIGSAAGKLFAEEGANVLLVDINEMALKHAVEMIGKDSVSYVVADVTQPETTQLYVNAAVERYGGIDIYLANAGIEGVAKPITDYPLDIFDQVMAINVRGVWLGMKYIIPKMLERGGGSIVITSSILGVKGGGGVSPYATSKHAVIGLMRSIAKEYADSNIRVNTVNPGLTDTRMMRSIEEQTGRTKEQFADDEPMKRYAVPEEIANMMLFLASDESSYCSGGAYMVDGANTA